MTLATGTRLGPYEISGAIGAGGMGEVYLAQDVRLDRRVALKVLPADVADDQDRRARFIREARAASALNHPNIITIHDIGDAAGVQFIAYEFVDGSSLRDVTRGAPLDVATVVDIGIQVTSALAEAHRAGIIHRDLKPENVMIRPTGLVKLLDFGIARLSRLADADVTSAAAMPGQTVSGMVIGTPQYMSPEQARGLVVDQQTDLFSLGVVLYELLSGTSPFAAATTTDTIVAVLTREPPRLTHVPTNVADIVSRALEKDRARRYATAEVMLHDLTSAKPALGGVGGRPAPGASERVDAPSSIAPGEPPPAPRPLTSLAVLPFANMSADADNEHLCDGLAEELLNALSRIDTLKVAARTSAFSFKGKAVDVGTIARTLGVTRVLDGSIRRSGNRLRISVQLVNAADGYQVWSERYDREIGDVFELQDEITLAVVAALKLKLFGEERAAVLKRYTDDAEAYELFLRGRHHAYKYTAQGWQRAIEYFEKAIALQPDYALAHAGIAAARGCQCFFGLLPAGQAIPQCRDSSTRALSIDGRLADAHLSLAITTFFYDWDWRGAERTFIRSIELNPNSAESLAYYALFLAFEGRVDEAMTAARDALALDPLAPLINMHAGWAYFTVGQPAEAARQAAKMIEIDPDFYGAYWLQGAIHLSAGHYDAAADQLRKAVALGGHPAVLADLASACSLAGATGEATAVLDRLVDLRRRDYVPAICLARVHSRLGNAAAAIEWLEAAFAERNGEMVFLDQEIAGAAADDPLRKLAGEPRVKALLDGMRLPNVA
jgi:serine/threonine protein kinase/tetratricopeptide (TPR) repeat protein